MTRKATTRMLGCAEYEAKWIDESQMVQLTARGFLPCANHQAQLEKRADGLWELVFYTQENSEESYTPFSLQVIVMVEGAAPAITVMDALGGQSVAIQNGSFEGDTGDHMVYFRKNAPEDAFFMVPSGTRVLPIFARAYGPASKPDCAAFIASGQHDFLEDIMRLEAKLGRVEVGED